MGLERAKSCNRQYLTRAIVCLLCLRICMIYTSCMVYNCTTISITTVSHAYTEFVFG